MTTFRLADAPLSLRILCTGFLLSVGLGLLVVALTVQAMVGGFTPQTIAEGIRGDEDAAVAAEFAEEFGEADKAAGLRFGKGYRELIQTTHTHSFAMPLLLFALGLVFFGTDTPDRHKALLYGVAFLALVLDLGSLWLVRYASAGFAYLNLGAGVMLGACAAVFIGGSLWALWRPRSA